VFDPSNPWARLYGRRLASHCSDSEETSPARLKLSSLAGMVTLVLRRTYGHVSPDAQFVSKKQAYFESFLSFAAGIGTQGIPNSILMMTKTKSTVINLPSASYTMG
jgi:hypothetical protein